MPIFPATGGSSSSSSSSVVRLSADIADKTDVTPADVTGLLFAVVSGSVYRFKAQIIFQTGATTTGIALGLTCPTFTRLAAVVRIPTGIDSATTEFQGYLTSSGDIVIGTGIETINTDFVATIEGIIIPSANGNVQFRYHSEVAASAVRIRSGSLVTVDLVA
jgi:hypothetical protein